MRPAKNTAQQQPRFMLRVHLGQLSYACRGCRHACHHVTQMMQHLLACQVR